MNISSQLVHRALSNIHEIKKISNTLSPKTYCLCSLTRREKKCLLQPDAALHAKLSNETASHRPANNHNVQGDADRQRPGVTSELNLSAFVLPCAQSERRKHLLMKQAHGDLQRCEEIICCPFTLLSTLFASHCEYRSKTFRYFKAKFVRDTTLLLLVNDVLVPLCDSHGSRYRYRYSLLAGRIFCSS